jgi:ABC-type Mn2+/Zn2+ transport system permease subunit
MSWIIEPFQYEFMRRALLACVLIGFTNGFLGAYVVLRRLALVADALSHSMLPGLALAAILIGLNTGGLLLGGLFAATFVALGGHLIASSSRMKDETAVASLYILAFALGVALIKHARVQVSLEHFLFGNILGIADSDLWTSYAISTVTLLTLVALQRPLLLALFEPSVAHTQGVNVGLLLALLIVLIVLAMISSLQAVGVLLSLGLLVFPAATIYLLSDSYAAMSWGGAVIGMAGGLIGLLISFWANIPSGPAIVMVLGALFVLAYLFGPKYGMISRWIRKRHLHEESLQRWK